MTTERERIVSERLLSEQALMLCYAIERAGSDALLTECSTIAGELRKKLTEWEDTRPLTEHEKHMIDGAWEKHKASAPRFNETFCSQCGRGFGPGDHGFSSCENHAGKRVLSR